MCMRGHVSASTAASRAQPRQVSIDVVATRMPKPRRRAASSRRRSPRRPRIFAQQKVAHARDRRHRRHAGDRTMSLATAPVVSAKVDQPIDGFGKLGGAARAVPHLAGDEARIDRARPHDARQRRRQRPRARPLRIGHIEHDKIGGAARAVAPPRQSRRRRRRPRRLRADRGRDRRWHARADRRRRRARQKRRARRCLRLRRRHRHARRRRDRRRRARRGRSSRPSRSSMPAP